VTTGPTKQCANRAHIANTRSRFYFFSNGQQLRRRTTRRVVRTLYRSHTVRDSHPARHNRHADTQLSSLFVVCLTADDIVPVVAAFAITYFKLSIGTRQRTVRPRWYVRPFHNGKLKIIRPSGGQWSEWAGPSLQHLPICTFIRCDENCDSTSIRRPFDCPPKVIKVTVT